jgi:hypothetical protein
MLEIVFKYKQVKKKIQKRQQSWRKTRIRVVWTAHMRTAHLRAADLKKWFPALFL